MGWLLVAIAIICEVGATIGLKFATDGKRRWYIPVAIGYSAAFTLLTVALGLGLPIGVVYGVWAASGVALTAVLGRYIFKDPLTTTMCAGIGLIIAGVFLVEVGH